MQLNPYRLNSLISISEILNASSIFFPGNLTGLSGSGLRSSHVRAELTVSGPQLWWPNGYGEQPLYQVEALLVPAKGACGAASENPGQEAGGAASENPRQDAAGISHPLDIWQKRIGLRTMTVNTDPLPEETWDAHLTDQVQDLDDGTDVVMSRGDRKILMVDRKGGKLQGRNFAFEVNGLQIFAMGADYIPEDNILTRQTRERTDMLLASAQEAHHNCIRIWGGGYFPDDFFYDVCDERGLEIGRAHV